MLAVGKGATESIEAQLSSFGSNLLSVRSANVKVGGVVGASARLRLELEDAAALKKSLPGVKSTSCYVQQGGKYVTYEDKNWSTSIYGVMPDYLHMHASDPDQGRIFSEKENQDRALVAIVGVTVSRQLFGEMNPIGKILKINKIPFQVIGILPEKGGSGPMDQDDRVMVPLNTAMFRLFGQTYVDVIEVEMEKGADMDHAEGLIDKILRARHDVPLSIRDEPFRVFNMADIQQALTQTSKTMALLLLSVAGISLLVGGIGIMNIMLVSVTERTKEIGLRKALGGTSSDILLQFLIESAAIGTFGGSLGAALGTLSSILVKLLAGWATSVSLVSVAGSFIFASFVGMLFGIWPANRAANLNPIEALRGE
jgi:macrolide transport system ATP-binding/permease protein